MACGDFHFSASVIIMKDIFFYTLRAILPILLIVFLGSITRPAGPWPDDCYKTLNQLCFRLFLPIHLFYNVYSVENLAAMNWKVLCYLFFSVFLCLALGLITSRLFVHDRGQKGAVIQASFRSNQAILGLPLANALGGEEAMAFASLGTSVCVPVFNVLAVVVLAIYSGEEKSKISAASLVRRVITNPLIIGCVSGVFMVVVRQLLPVASGVPVFTIRNQLPSVYQAIENLSRVASPVMLFVLGTRLNFSSVSGLLPQLRLGLLLRLVICPAVVLGLALILRKQLGLTTLEMPTLIAVSSTPVAVSSAVMVQEMGGDDQLAGQLVVLSSVFSVISMFCVVSLMRFCGLL